MTRGRRPGARRAVAAGVLAAAVAVSLPARGQTVDDWFGADKALHFSVSALLAGGGYAGAATLTPRPEVRAGVGAGFALTLGVAKEVWDAAGGGDPSWRDLAWDALGAGVGVLSAWLVDRLVHALLAPAPLSAR